MTHYADTRTETSKDTMTKTHDFTPEFLQTPGLHLVSLGVLQRYVAQEDDQPVGVRAGEEFTVLRHNRNQPALPLTAEQASFLRLHDVATSFNPQLLTRDEVEFVLALLCYGALVSVYGDFEGEALVEQLDFVPVFTRNLTVVEDRGREGYRVQITGGEPDIIGGPTLVLSNLGMDLVIMNMDMIKAQGKVVPLGAAADAVARMVFSYRAAQGVTGVDLTLEELHREVFTQALAMIGTLTQYGAFGFEAASPAAEQEV